MVGRGAAFGRRRNRLGVGMSRWAGGAALALLTVAAGAQIVAVPPAVNRGGTAAKTEAAATLLAPAGAPRYSITLSAPSADEQARLQQRSAAGRPALVAKRQVRAIGFARAVPNADRSLTLSALPWQSLPDGSKVAQVAVTSPGAAAIRLGLRMEAG